MNKPTVKVGIVAVSRDCFPESLSVTRRQNLVNAYKAKYNADEIYECRSVVVAHVEIIRKNGFLAKT